MKDKIREICYDLEMGCIDWTEASEQLFALCDVGKRSELLLFDEYIYSNECQHDRDRGGVVDRYLAKK